MKLKWLGTALTITVGTASSQTAVPPATPAFEVASVRPTDAAFSGRSVQMPPGDGRITMRGWSLKDLILFAWGSGVGLHPSLISGGPGWFDHDRFDIAAKAEGSSVPSQSDRKLMLRALLMQRFHLAIHRESKPTPVYALLLGKSGPKMKERRPNDGGAPFGLPLNGLRMPGRNASMAQLADILQSLIPLTDPERDDRPVVDKTGLTGNFDFDLAWAPDPALSGGRGDATGLAKGPDIFIALEEQLGLRLEMQKVPMEVLFIDHAEKPSAN